MRKGKLKFKSGRGIKGTICVPSGSLGEIAKLPDGALGFVNESNALMMKHSGQLIPVGGGDPVDPPIPPDPTPDPNAFIVTCEYFAESSPDHKCVLGISFSQDATVTVVNGAGELLVRGEDYDFFEDAYSVVFAFNDDGEPSKYTITVKGEIEAISSDFSSRDDDKDTNTLEIISFGGIQAEVAEETGLHTLILDVTYITAIRSWAGLHNIEAFVLSNDVFLETLPNSLAPLAHMKRVIFDLVLVRNGALTGYEEFAQNKEYFQFARCPFWKGDVRRFANALDAAGFDPMQVVMSTQSGVFESAMSAKKQG